MALSYSYSSFSSFDRCKRKFYYSQIAAHHNVKNDPLRREAFYLKQLTPAIFWPGKLVESAIEEILIVGQPKSTNITRELFEFAKKLSEDQMNFSLSNQFRNVTKKEAKSKYFRLFEHEYNLDDDGILDSVLLDASTCFNNYPSIILTEIGLTLNNLLETAYLKEKQEKIRFPMYDTWIECWLDCLVIYNSKVIVIDWKVSKTTASDFSRQLMLYAFAVLHSKWGKNKRLGDIYCFEVNLYNCKVKSYRLSSKSIIDIENYIFDYVKRIDGFTQKKGYNELDIEDFPMCENLNVCENCNFQRLCTKKGVYHESQQSILFPD